VIYVLNMSSCALTENYAKMHIGVVEVQLHAFLISALDEGEWLALRTVRFIPRERAHITH